MTDTTEPTMRDILNAAMLPRPTTEIEAIAQVIEAAGFRAMANQYRYEPRYRDQIGRAMVRNIRNDARFGAPMADKLAGLLRHVTNGYRTA